MSLIDDIIEGEIVFPRRFANAERRGFGVCYYTPNIPDSHIGNHAHILEPCEIKEAVDEIEDFYRTQNITPRIDHYSRPGQGCGKQLREILKERGYQFVSEEYLFYIHRRSSQIKSVAGISIRRVQEPLPELLAMVEQTENERSMKVLRNSLQCPDFYLLVGFVDDKPVSIAGLEQYGPIGRVDEVRTAKPARGKGYCSAVMDELIRYHRQVFGGELCLCTDNPAAARIYKKAGFEKIDGEIESWSAWLD